MSVNRKERNSWIYIIFFGQSNGTIHEIIPKMCVSNALNDIIKVPKSLLPSLIRYQWWRVLFRCRIDLLNFPMGFNIIAPYMVCVTHKWISPSLISFYMYYFVWPKFYQCLTYICRCCLDMTVIFLAHCGTIMTGSDDIFKISVLVIPCKGFT